VALGFSAPLMPLVAWAGAAVGRALSRAPQPTLAEG
jgi:hypothetical protein